jgi:hypothetical protein
LRSKARNIPTRTPGSVKKASGNTTNPASPNKTGGRIGIKTDSSMMSSPTERIMISRFFV